MPFFRVLCGDQSGDACEVFIKASTSEAALGRVRSLSRSGRFFGIRRDLGEGITEVFESEPLSLESVEQYLGGVDHYYAYLDSQEAMDALHKGRGVYVPWLRPLDSVYSQEELASMPDRPWTPIEKMLVKEGEFFNELLGLPDSYPPSSN